MKIKDSRVPVNIIMMRDMVLDMCPIPPHNRNTEQRLHFELRMQVTLHWTANSVGRKKGEVRKTTEGWCPKLTTHSTLLSNMIC